MSATRAGSLMTHTGERPNYESSKGLKCALAWLCVYVCVYTCVCVCVCTCVCV